MAHCVPPVCCRGPHLRRIAVVLWMTGWQHHALGQQRQREETPAILSLSRQKLDVSVLCDDLPRAATCCSRKRSSPLGATDFPSSTNTRRWQDGHCQVSCLANAIICIIAIPPHPGVPLFLDQQLETFVSPYWLAMQDVVNALNTRSSTMHVFDIS